MVRVTLDHTHSSWRSRQLRLDRDSLFSLFYLPLLKPSEFFSFLKIHHQIPPNVSPALFPLDFLKSRRLSLNHSRRQPQRLYLISISAQSKGTDGFNFDCVCEFWAEFLWCMKFVMWVWLWFLRWSCRSESLGFAEEKMQRQTRLMERNNSMRGKRQMEGGEEEQPERKRPALAR